MFPSIETLAREIDATWSQVGHCEADFPRIVASCLDRPLDLDFSTLARRIFAGAELPEQRRLDEGFGQPALTLYHGERFLIEALCWHSGTPAIHQHAFSGAFRVVTGQSVHSRYSFTERDRLGPISLGELRLKSVELLDDRSIVEIPRGVGLIHSAFHLDSPSMTIVARTHQTSEPEPTYLPPGVAYDSSARSPGLHKRLQLLDTMNQTGHESYSDCVQAAIDHCDLYDGMAILMRAGGHRVNDATYRSFTERFCDRHGSRTTPIVSALVEERRRGAIVRLRSTVTDQHVRFFLASLLSFSRRDELLTAMVQRYGDQGGARQGIAIGVASLLGGERDKQIVTTTAVEAILDDVPRRSFPERAANRWNRALTADEAEKLERFYGQLLEEPLLVPLLRARHDDE
jgi:hypothetical protein